MIKFEKLKCSHNHLIPLNYEAIVAYLDDTKLD